MTRSLLIIAVAAITSTSLAANANAGHASFCYVGKTCGFDGETHMIEALSLMDQAYLSPCNITRRRLVSHARLEVLSAMRTACNRTTRYEMLGAYKDLTRFLLTNDNCYLDTAAASVTTAIELSQVFHADHHGHHDIHDHHQVARPVVVHHTPVVRTTRRVVVPAHNLYRDVPHHHHGHRSAGSIRIGGGRSGISFRIGF